VLFGRPAKLTPHQRREVATSDDRHTAATTLATARSIAYDRHRRGVQKLGVEVSRGERGPDEDVDLAECVFRRCRGALYLFDHAILGLEAQRLDSRRALIKAAAASSRFSSLKSVIATLAPRPPRMRACDSPRARCRRGDQHCIAVEVLRHRILPSIVIGEDVTEKGYRT
jgi:hypothetical protein